MLYSAKTGGFYAADIHGSAVPADCVEISDEQHAALLTGQSNGLAIAADRDGHPILIDPVAATSQAD